MRVKTNKEEATKIMIDLYKTYSPEQIAVGVGKSVQTIYAWKAGTRTPCLGDMAILKEMWERRLSN